MASDMKKLKGGWIRDLIQESGDVLRWYEKSAGNIIASIVKSDLSNTAEIRISGDEFEDFSAQLPLEKVSKYTDATNLMKIESLIKRERMK